MNKPQVSLVFGCDGQIPGAGHRSLEPQVCPVESFPWYFRFWLLKPFEPEVHLAVAPIRFCPFLPPNVFLPKP